MYKYLITGIAIGTTDTIKLEKIVTLKYRSMVAAIEKAFYSWCAEGNDLVRTVVVTQATLLEK